ncbi:MAG TPA: cyanophycinase [Pyrinomonadaceae bacterium]|nr:cyanophycinase [Acidobacteriota bacterium]HQZ95508.1 cyanophycinase [Pyrinomonadaceae bacterium]
MKMKARFTLGFAVFVLLVQLAAGQQRLMVVGGGTRPAEATKKFVEWSGGTKSKILVITWASGEEDSSYDGTQKVFMAANPGSVEHAVVKPLDAERRAKFIEQLKNATGVYFGGGDQNRIMDVLKDEELLKLIRAKYAAGTPFGGTSAGAAVMSDPMMTGEADLKILDGKKVGVRPAIGFVPDVMFDQHFLLRQRHNRLFGFVMENPRYLGIGINEGMAVMIENNRDLTTVGPTQVMFIDAKDRKGAMLVHFLNAGERFDLKKRKPIKK